MAGLEPADPRATRVRLEMGRTAVEVAPGIGGRLSALEIDGWDVLRRDGWTDREWGCFVMAPWVGRLRDARVAWAGQSWQVPATEPPHALHGTVMDEPWLLADRSARSVRLERTLGPDWPPGGRLIHAVALDEGRLRLPLEVHADRDPTPAVIGWHPWFRRRAVHVASAGRAAEARESIDDALRRDDGRRPTETGDVEVTVDARRRLELDGAGLPTGVLAEPRGDPRDDVLLGVSTPPVVRWPGGPTLRLEAGGEAAWIVYTAHPDGVWWSPSRACRTGSTAGCWVSHRSPDRWSR